MNSKVKILLYCTKSKPYLYNVGVEKWWYNEGCYEPFDYREGFRLFDKLQKTNRYKQGDYDVQIGDLLNGNLHYVIIDSAPAKCITEAINAMQ